MKSLGLNKMGEKKSIWTTKRELQQKKTTHEIIWVWFHGYLQYLESKCEHVIAFPWPLQRLAQHHLIASTVYTQVIDYLSSDFFSSVCHPLFSFQFVSFRFASMLTFAFPTDGRNNTVTSSYDVFVAILYAFVSKFSDVISHSNRFIIY